jgi:hypothetical protein
VTGLLNWPIGQIGAGALVSIVVLLIFTGRLVTRRQLEDVQADRDHWRTAAEGWQAMATKLGMSTEALTSSVEQLTAASGASTHALEQIQSTMRDPR